jgi:hypothetical protein
MATTPVTTQATAYSGPSAKFSAYDEYMKQLKAKQAAEPAPLTQATEFYQKAITGGTPATQASIEAGRSALSRQATNQRAQAAQAVAGTGQLGQGTAGRSMQQAENKIAETLAASRLSEAQMVGGQQENAVKSLVSMQTLKDDTGWKQYQSLAASANPADQAAAAKWLAENSAQAGFQRPDNTVEMSDAATQAAQNDPAYIASQAQQQMEAKKQTALLSASNLQGLEKIKAFSGAGLMDEAKAETARLPTTGGVGQVVNFNGTPVQITKATPNSMTRMTAFEGQNILTGEIVRYLG